MPPTSEPFAVFDDPAGEDFSVGVEEEFFLVDAETRQLRGDAADVLERATAPAGSAIEAELKQSQVESGTAVCHDLADVRASIVGLRRALGQAAEDVGARLLASATHPFARWNDDGGITDEVAYVGLHHTYGLLTDEQSVSGCHIHVGVRDPELAIGIMNRVRGWLPVLVALSANSPYWMGRDSRYASYRTEVFHRWPMAGIPEHLPDRAAFDRLVDHLHAVEAIDAPGRLYWDVRPSARYPTLEFRAADVLMTVDEVVATAAIVRALVEVLHAQAEAGAPLDPPRTEVLRSALWRAARYGLADQLVDVQAMALRPAGDVLDSLLGLVRPVLEDRGEWADVSATVAFVRREGTGAERQRRAVAAADGDLSAAVDRVAVATLAGTT
ncbi:glutamate--cysteine ligase [Aquihabitans sp. G128]|uniref:carboxylate-amine ligase n=1 Tax=Aquihabitans sp. G128 TaxID=2849779 RepID=UPI001C237EB4|nr:glutamate--cysteine ligase [Aquihabitans sp. G128]QXC60886.1 glutamate--cysteine ligase [Aquihabitans sp. G128]